MIDFLLQSFGCKGLLTIPKWSIETSYTPIIINLSVNTYQNMIVKLAFALIMLASNSWGHEMAKRRKIKLKSHRDRSTQACATMPIKTNQVTRVNGRFYPKRVHYLLPQLFKRLLLPIFNYKYTLKRNRI